MALREVRLSDIVEGVEATMLVFGYPVSVLVVAEALQAKLGASEEATNWLDVFQRYANDIEHTARKTHKSGNKVVVLQHL